MKPEKVGADSFIAAGLDEADLQRLPRGKLGEPGDPIVAATGDDLSFTWPALTVELRLTHPDDGPAGIHAELTASLGGKDEFWGRLNLASTLARQAVVRTLREIDRGIPWRALVEMVCQRGAQAARKGEPIIALMPKRQAIDSRYLIHPLLLRSETTIIHADGGTGKSLLALALTVMVSAGVDLPTMRRTAQPVPCLYLDYESGPEEHADRLALLMAGFGLQTAPPILYRKMIRPLSEETALLRAEISRHAIEFVTLDSLAPGSGSEPESADAAIRTLNALRSFGATSRLVLAHVSKASADQRTGMTRPFGSVFVQNLARSVWELRRGEESLDDLVVGLYHRKLNVGRRHAPIGLRFLFTERALSIHPADLTQEADLAVRTSVAFRIQTMLAAGPRTVDDLVEQGAGSKETVTRTLRRLRMDGRVVPSGRDTWELKR
jgi:AAA domain